jgi:hypothetical protein
MNMVMQVSGPSYVLCLILTFRQLRKVTCHPYLLDGAVRLVSGHIFSMP